LLEPMLRRTTFLGECVTELGLGNVMVCRGRAEDVAGVIRADVALSRAVAPLGRLAELSVGVVRPGGTILALKGSHAQTELDEAGPVLRQLSVQSAEVLRVGHGIVEPPATVVRILAAGKARRRSRRPDTAVG
jgi:16S rRNA (guanine527-N7)-methyltransferase